MRKSEQQGEVGAASVTAKPLERGRWNVLEATRETQQVNKTTKRGKRTISEGVSKRNHQWNEKGFNDGDEILVMKTQRRWKKTRCKMSVDLERKSGEKCWSCYALKGKTKVERKGRTRWVDVVAFRWIFGWIKEGLVYDQLRKGVEGVIRGIIKGVEKG